MRHRRDHADVVTFDLEPESDRDDLGAPFAAVDGGESSREVMPGDDVPGEVPPSVVVKALRRAVGTVAAWPLRRKLVAGGTVLGLVAAGTGVAVTVDVLQDRALAARVLAAPGGVVSLADAPAALWRTELAHPQPVAMMDGLLVVSAMESRNGVSDGNWITLHALDPVDGTVRWSTEVEGSSGCSTAPGPGDGWSGQVGSASTVVCPTGDTGSGVTVVGADGQVVAERDLEGHTDEESVMPLPGALLRITRVGTAARAPYGGSALGEDFTTRAMAVRMEDAVTGEVRWETTVPGATAPAGTGVDFLYPCTRWSADGSVAERVTDDGVGYSWRFTSEHAWFGACGVNATFDLATGEVVRSVDPFDPATGSWDPGVVPVDGGGYTARLPYPLTGGALVGDETSRVWRADGSVVGDVPGSVISPIVTDGSAPRALLASSSRGLAAFDPADAAPLWTLDGSGGWPVARTERALVVQTGSSYVVVDQRSGQERWRASPPDQQPGETAGSSHLVGAFTDGRRLMLAEVRDVGLFGEDGTAEMVWRGFDLATGAILWTLERTATPPVSIDGRLYEFGGDAVVALG